MPIDTWVEFVVELRLRFQPIASAVAARTNLDRGSQTGSVASYNSFFQTNMSYIGDMGIADQIHQYTRGLKDAIRLEVIKLKVTTLAGAINAAVAAEAYLPSSGRTHSTFAPRTHRNYHPYGGAASSSSSSSAMDLSNINSVHGGDSEDGHGPSEFHHPGPSPRERALEAQLKELQMQQKVQSSVNAMFGKPRQHDDASSSSRSSSRFPRNENRVPNISKEDVARCRLENRCLRCKEVGHIAAECTKQPRSNF